MELTQWDVRADASGVAEARQNAADLFVTYEVTPREQQILLLLVSELVTNAVIHAAPPIVLSVQVDASRVRVTVSDGDAMVPRVRTNDTSSTGGRGLALVETLASDWGISYDGTGKRVWFELERPTRALRRHSGVRERQLAS